MVITCRRSAGTRSRSRTARPGEPDDLLGTSLFRWGQYTRLDRIDLYLEVPTLPYAQLTDAAPGEPAGIIRARAGARTLLWGSGSSTWNVGEGAEEVKAIVKRRLCMDLAVIPLRSEELSVHQIPDDA